MKTKSQTNQAVTLIEVLAVVATLAAVGLLLLGWIENRRAPSGRLRCRNHLFTVGLAFRIFAADNEGRFPMQFSVTNGGSAEFVEDASQMWRHFLAMSNELGTPKIVICPSDFAPRREAADFSTNASGAGPPRVAFSQNANVSYFVGVDATTKLPQALLAGDRHLTISNQPVGSGMLMMVSNSPAGWTMAMHDSVGNVVFVDGHVEPLNSRRLRQALSKTGLATNRLAIP